MCNNTFHASRARVLLARAAIAKLEGDAAAAVDGTVATDADKNTTMDAAMDAALDELAAAEWEFIRARAGDFAAIKQRVRMVQDIFNDAELLTHDLHSAALAVLVAEIVGCTGSASDDAEIERLQDAKCRALAIADERSKENVALRAEIARLQDNDA